MDAPLEELKARFLSVYGEIITRDGADDLLRWLTESDFFVALILSISVDTFNSKICGTYAAASRAA